VATEENEIRTAAIEWVAAISDGGRKPVSWRDLSNWSYRGARVPLVSQQGIFKPAALSLPISIRTTPLKSGRPAPYQDEITHDGFLAYAYRGTDPQHADNVRLRQCMEAGFNLLYFEGIESGIYSASLASIISDRPADLRFDVALFDLDVSVAGLAAAGGSAIERRYFTTTARRRAHQAAFRHQVVRAYAVQCAMCRLKHGELLDAAHIIEDAQGGRPEVSNGVALCKIHHAAFDTNIVGIRPDMTAHVRTDILYEIDGPMLRHGLQEMHNRKLVVPRRSPDKPNPNSLEERYTAFLVTA